MQREHRIHRTVDACWFPSATAIRMQNLISVSILLVGLALALLGAWLLWGPLSVLVVSGAALFAYGLASID